MSSAAVSYATACRSITSCLLFAVLAPLQSAGYPAAASEDRGRHLHKPTALGPRPGPGRHARRFRRLSAGAPPRRQSKDTSGVPADAWPCGPGASRERWCVLAPMRHVISRLRRSSLFFGPLPPPLLLLLLLLIPVHLFSSTMHPSAPLARPPQTIYAHRATIAKPKTPTEDTSKTCTPTSFASRLIAPCATSQDHACGDGKMARPCAHATVRACDCARTRPRPHAPDCPLAFARCTLTCTRWATSSTYSNVHAEAGDEEGPCEGNGGAGAALRPPAACALPEGAKGASPKTV